MSPMRHLSIIVALCLLNTYSYRALAKGTSYIYIQGDKEIPFYVKVDGTMMPRYFKNHLVIPHIEMGSHIIEIMFEQNQLEPIDFSIVVPEQRHIGFLLCKRDGKYMLYDLATKQYIAPIVR